MLPICETLKQNAPFQCSKTEVSFKSGLEILSLSIANVQLVYGILTVLATNIFYKMKKKEATPAIGATLEMQEKRNSWTNPMQTT